MSVDDDSAHFLVLSNHKWGTLVWPLAIVPEGRIMSLMLVGDASCRWEFVYCLDSWRATPTVTKWSEEFGVVLKSIGPSESVRKNSLRFSNSLTFQHLVRMGNDLKLHAPKKLSRKDLLHELAKVLSPDDPGFIELVIEQDTKSKKGAVSSGNLIACLFEQLDGNEKKDFEDMKEAVEKSAKAMVQKKWKTLLDEKNAELKVTWMNCFFEFNLYTVICTFVKNVRMSNLTNDN